MYWTKLKKNFTGIVYKTDSLESKNWLKSDCEKYAQPFRTNTVDQIWVILHEWLMCSAGRIADSRSGAQINSVSILVIQNFRTPRPAQRSSSWIGGYNTGTVETTRTTFFCRNICIKFCVNTGNPEVLNPAAHRSSAVVAYSHFLISSWIGGYNTDTVEVNFLLYFSNSDISTHVSYFWWQAKKHILHINSKNITKTRQASGISRNPHGSNKH